MHLDALIAYLGNHPEHAIGLIASVLFAIVSLVKHLIKLAVLMLCLTFGYVYFLHSRGEDDALLEKAKTLIEEKAKPALEEKAKTVIEKALENK